MSLRNKLRFVGLSDTGKVREHNEDTIAVDPDIGLLVLADGMGGYNAGEVASGIAVKTIVNLVRESPTCATAILLSNIRALTTVVPMPSHWGWARAV